MTGALGSSEEALRFIVGLLTERCIPFVVSGGLAARLYGCTRPLYDIDIDIPGQRFADLAPTVAPYLVRPWGPFRDEHFDLLLATLDYGGQPIDLTAGDSVRLFDGAAGIWRRYPTDFSAIEYRTLFGLTLPVQARASLMEYKRYLARPVDLEDLGQLQ